MRKIAAALVLSTLLPACATMGAQPQASLGDVPSKGPVGKTITANSEKFAACARDSVTVQTGLVQTLQLRFMLDEKGDVTRSRIDQMSSPDPDLRTCVLLRLRRIKFPSPGDRKPKDIHYPLVLRPE